MRSNSTKTDRKLFVLLVASFALLSLSGCSLLQPSTPARSVARENATEQTIDGRVVAVLDGDTIDVLDSSKTMTRIRIKGIDAPEKAQAFGSASKQHIASLVFSPRASVLAGKG